MTRRRVAKRSRLATPTLARWWRAGVAVGLVAFGLLLSPLVLTPAQAAFVQRFVNISVTTLATLNAVVVGSGSNMGVGSINASGSFYRNGTLFAASHLSNGVTGSGPVVLAGSPSLTTPVLGAATATGITAGYLRATASAIVAFASHASMDQATSSVSRLLAFGPPGAGANGIWSIETARSDGSGALIPMRIQAGVQIGGPAGGDKGSGSINIAGQVWQNGTRGLTQTITLCGGTITVVEGIVLSSTC